MPVSGNEQPGVSARHSSIPSAGVPIKKRKFPSWNLSPPQEQGSVENRQSSPSPDSSIMNSSVVTTTSPGNSDASKSHLLDVKKESIPDYNNSSFNSENFPKAKLHEPNNNFGLGAEENVDSKENVKMGLKRAQENNPSHLELHLAPKEAPSVPIMKASPVEQLSAISKDARLSLGPKEPLVSSLSGLRTEGTHKLKDFDAASLSLCLSKEKCDTPGESRDVDLQSDDFLVHSNRFNWDLNTTMEAWEDSVDKSAIPEAVAFDGLTGNDVMHGIKPSLELLGIGDGRGKQILEAGEHRSSLPALSSSSQHYKSDDSLRLSLGNSFSQSNFGENHSGLATLIASPSILSNVKSRKVLASAGIANAVGHSIVKSEPCDESPKHDQVVVKDRHTGLSDLGTAKTELVVRSDVETVMAVDMNPQTAVVPRSVKSEPVLDGNREVRETVPQNSVGKNVPQENLLATKAIPSQTKNLVSPSDLMSVSGDILNSESSSTIQKEPQMAMDNPPVTCKSVDQVASESNSVHEEAKELNAYAGTSNICTPEVTKSDCCEESGSDHEKINISNDMLEDDPYGSDYESDGNQVPVSPTPTEQKKHGEDEDCEVTESLAHAAAEGSRATDKEIEKVIPPEYNSEDSSDGNITSVPAIEKDIEADICVKMDVIHIKECIDSVPSIKTDQTEDESTYEQELLSGNPSADKQRPTGADHPFDQSERDDVIQGGDQDFSAGGTLTEGQGGENIVGQPADENNIIGNDTNNDDSTLPTVGAPVNGKDAAKDSNSGGNRSRIINLPRGSPLRTRPFQEGSFGRERFDGEKSHLQRNRGEFYNDGPRKFLRGRFRGQTFRNFRQNYGRGRGRGYGRSDSRTEWHSDRTFMPGNFNGTADFRFPRRNRNPVGGVKELECNGYGDLVGSGRGRTPVNDEFPSFRHQSSRRLDGPAMRGVPGLRRIPRNFSPNRCAGGDGSDLAGLRHGESFVRGMPDDMRDPTFTRPQPPYEGLDSQFIRGNRNFFPGQKRAGPPRVRSKSPERSRLRSSPQRSPDGFNGNLDFTHRGSPVFRMVSRRHGSPPFMTQPIREMDAGRPHGHPRPIIPNRAPSDRVLPRNTRRFEGLEGREKTENDNHIGKRTGRFPEVGGDGSGRNFSERHGGLARPFRGGGGAEGESFRCHTQDGPNRPFRSGAEPDSELVERNSPRDREFDRRIKNRAVTGPRRPQNVEGQDGGAEQAWNNDKFDEGSHVKRRRF